FQQFTSGSGCNYGSRKSYCVGYQKPDKSCESNEWKRNLQYDKCGSSSCLVVLHPSSGEQDENSKL
ncbi:hypothetical protein Bhyg_01769, partial [Pseudolycoriella hygida]